MSDHDLRATQVLAEYDAAIDHDLRVSQVVVEYDQRIDHDLRVSQVIIEYDWLESPAGGHGIGGLLNRGLMT